MEAANPKAFSPGPSARQYLSVLGQIERFHGVFSARWQGSPALPIRRTSFEALMEAANKKDLRKVANPTPRLGASILRKVEGLKEAAALGVNLLLQLQNAVEQCFRTWRAARNVNVDGNHLVDSLHDRVIVEHAARGGARSHRDHPFRFRHLFVKLPD